MKQVYSTAIALFSFLFSFAAPVNTASTGVWNSTSTWSLNRLPVDGDTIVVPNGVNLTVDNNMMNNSSNYYFKIFGNLKFNGGKLDMGVNSKIMLFTNATVSGSSPSDELLINGVDKYKGNQATIVGPAYASSATAAAPSGFTATTQSSLLPVVFIGFNVARQNNDVLIQWSTAQEINAARFEVEKSNDGSTFTTTATITAIGNSNSVQSYSYTDRNVLKAYYRIKQVDQDGRATYTAVRLIKNESTSVDARVSAVTQNKVVLQFNQQVNSEVAVRIISLNGAVVAQQQINKPIGQVIINTPSLKGNYIVSITNNQDVNTNTQILF